MIKAVFLDFDETIFDHQHSSQQGLLAIGEKHPVLLEKPIEWLESEFWILHDWNYKQVLTKEITMDEARIARIEKLFEVVGEKAPADQLSALGQLYKNKYTDSARAIPGIGELVARLKSKGYFVGIITNGLTEVQKNRLKSLGLDAHFDYLIASEEANSEKPDKKIFQYALEKAGCNASEAIMIGDAWDKDVIGALEMGMKAIWLKRREDPASDSERAPIAATVEELEKILIKEQIL